MFTVYFMLCPAAKTIKMMMMMMMMVIVIEYLLRRWKLAHDDEQKMPRMRNNDVKLIFIIIIIIIYSSSSSLFRCQYTTATQPLISLHMPLLAAQTDFVVRGVPPELKINLKCYMLSLQFSVIDFRRYIQSDIFVNMGEFVCLMTDCSHWDCKDDLHDFQCRR